MDFILLTKLDESEILMKISDIKSANRKDGKTLIDFVFISNVSSLQVFVKETPLQIKQLIRDASFNN